MIVICDIDGTASNVEHRRHYVADKPKRWDLFYSSMTEDEPNPWCYELLRAMCEQNHRVIFVTGRPENYREQTEAWLLKHYGGIFCDPSDLYMRPADNTEPDYIIKHRIYKEHLSNMKILFVVDDRQQVVDMWREQGLTVLQCDKGDF